jgi:hypothetical protein
MITLKEFFMGRDVTFASVLTPEITKNAEDLLTRVNFLLALFYTTNPKAHSRRVNSGWRPPALNAKTPGAAPMSNHMTGKAIDVGDDDGSLDEWLMTLPGQKALVDARLWIEHPSATPRWSHFQSVPPRSGRRVFHP